jgi:hypothetical protein
MSRLLVRQHVVLVVGGVTIALALAGCGGGGAKAAAVTSSTPASTSAQASAAASPGDSNAAAGFAKYAACLQAHGAPVPSFSPGSRPSGSPRPRPTGSFSRPPGGGFGGPDASADPSTSAARAACASLRPQGGGFGGAGGRTISAATFAAFKSCMTDQGVTITATDPQQAIRGLDRVDPKTVAALKVCQPILGQGLASSAPSSSAAPSA